MPPSCPRRTSLRVLCTLFALRAAGLDVADQDTVAVAAGAVAPAGCDRLALPEGEQFGATIASSCR
jgi:hypothetical protein